MTNIAELTHLVRVSRAKKYERKNRDRDEVVDRRKKTFFPLHSSIYLGVIEEKIHQLPHEYEYAQDQISKSKPSDIRLQLGSKFVTFGNFFIVFLQMPMIEQAPRSSYTN